MLDYHILNFSKELRVITKDILKSLFLALVVLGLLGSVAFGKSGDQKGATKGLKKTSTDDAYAYIDINQVLRWISNNGDGSFDPNTGVAGNYWPKGTSNTCVYEDGLVYGGYVTGGGVTKELRLTGSTYRHAFQAGQIVKNASGNPVADDPTKSIYRIFKIQKNFHSFAASDPKLYAQMKQDYLDWPGTMGAPYVDMNGDGVFQPPVLDADDNLVSGDSPQFLGDQVLYCVSNDMNAGKSKFVYGSAGLGMEIQRTVWGYALTGSIGNSWFERYRLINKGGLRVDSMRVGLWADIDLGGGAKDLNGSDTSIQLGTYGTEEMRRQVDRMPFLSRMAMWCCRVPWYRELQPTALISISEKFLATRTFGWPPMHIISTVLRCFVILSST